MTPLAAIGSALAILLAVVGISMLVAEPRDATDDLSDEEADAAFRDMRNRG